MVVKSIEEAELAGVAGRLEREFPRDGFSLDNVRRKVGGDPDYTPELNLAAWEDERLRGALLGTRRGERAFVKALTVWPETAVADALLADFEASARRLGATELQAGGSAPNYFLPGVDPTDTPTLGYYLERGFERVRDAFNMTADLTSSDWETEAEELALRREGIHCRRLLPTDRPALAEFMRSHFSEGWLTETCVGYDVDPVPVQVAWHERRIVAFAAAEVTNPGWFGPMGTAPDYRRHGLGRVLLRRGLADLRAFGYREAQIGWVGPLGFYARHCGARVSRLFWMLRRPLSPE